MNQIISKQTIQKVTAYSLYLAIIIETLMVVIDKSYLVNPIEGQLFRITFLLCVIKVAGTKYSYKEYIGFGALFLLCFLSYRITGRNELMRFLMFIMACKDVDVKKCLKISFYITLAGCAAIILCSLIGIGGDLYIQMDYGRGEMERRYCFGMGHPNSLQCMILSLSVLAIFLYGQQWNIIPYMGILLLNILCFMLTQSKTSIMIAVYGILCFMLIRFAKIEFLKKLLAGAQIVATVGSVLVSIWAAKEAMALWYYYVDGVHSQMAYFIEKIDKLMTGRIASLIETINHEGTIETWSLFSRPENYYYFDMGWVRLFYWYGIIPAALCILGLILFMIYCYRQKHYEALVVCGVIAIYSIVEAHYVSVYFGRNYLLLIIGMYLFQYLQGKTRKESEKDNGTV